MDSRPPEGDSLYSLQAENLDREAALREAQRWLARFAPVIHGMETASAEECRRRIALLQDLKRTVPDALRRMEVSAGPEDVEIADTLRTAVLRLEGVEDTLRRRLAALAPGDPEAKVDLEALREDLAEVAARNELEQAVGHTISEQPALSMLISPPNLAGAAGMGLFSLSWLSFTAFHATLMIGGMYNAFGPLALALLGFYALFFGVGLGLARAALQMASREEIVLEGRRLTVRKTFMGRTSERCYPLAHGVVARVEQPSTGFQGTNQRPVFRLVLAAEQGRDIQLGGAASPGRLRECAQRINEYLKGVR